MLTDRQTMQMMSLGVLMGRVPELLGEVLSPFEHALVLDVAARFVTSRAEARITDAEWIVIGKVIDCLRTHVTARIAQAEAAERAA